MQNLPFGCKQSCLGWIGMCCEMLQCLASPGLGRKAVAQGAGVFASSGHAAGCLGSQITHLLLSSLLESVLSVLE